MLARPGDLAPTGQADRWLSRLPDGAIDGLLDQWPDPESTGRSTPGSRVGNFPAAAGLYSVTGCGTDFLPWKWAEMDRAAGEVAA